MSWPGHGGGEAGGQGEEGWGAGLEVLRVPPSSQLSAAQDLGLSALAGRAVRAVGGWTPLMLLSSWLEAQAVWDALG